MSNVPPPDSELEAPARTRPGLRRFGVVLVGLALVYLVAANVLLNTERGKRLIAPRSPRVQLAWSSAYTVVPGLVHVRGFSIEQQTQRLDWYLRLERANVLINLLTLPTRRLSLARANGRGVECGFEITPPKDRVPRPRKTNRGWILALRNVSLEELEGCATPRAVLTGEGKLRASLLFQIRGPMTLEDVHVELSNAEVERLQPREPDRAATDPAASDPAASDPAVSDPAASDPAVSDPAEGAMADSRGEIIAEALELELDATSTPFMPKEVKVRGLLAHLSGDLTFMSRTSSLAFLNAYFVKAPWLDLSSGPGELDMALELERGTLVSQSRIHFKSEDLQVRYLDYLAAGGAELIGLVQGETPTISAQFQEFSVRQSGEVQPYILGRELMVRAVASHANLAETPHVDVSVDLPTSTVPDLTAYNTYLPPKVGIEIVEGEGTVAAHLELSSVSPGSGNVTLESENLALRAGELEMRGGLALTTEFRDVDPTERSFGISHSLLELSESTIHREGELLEEDWHAEIALTKGRLELRRPMTGQASIALSMTDSRPILSFFAERKPKLEMVAKLINIKNIEGTGELAFVPGSMYLDALELEGKRVRIEGRLCLGEAQRLGALWARSFGVGVAAYFNGSDRRWTLLRPRRWYEDRRSRVGCGEAATLVPKPDEAQQTPSGP